MLRDNSIEHNALHLDHLTRSKALHNALYGSTINNQISLLRKFITVDFHIENWLLNN